MGDRKTLCELPVSSGIGLRLLEEADVPELYALIDSNRSHLARWLPWAEAQTFVDTEEFVGRCRDQVLGNDGFQAALVSAGSIAGVAGFTAVDWGRRATSVGYWLAADRQGRGAMTAAVRLLVHHAFSVWDLDRVEIRAATENRRSRAIPERLGFDQEGTLREAEQVGARRLDLVVYSTIATAWKAQED